MRAAAGRKSNKIRGEKGRTELREKVRKRRDELGFSGVPKS